MTFDKVLPQFINGKKIRRRLWKQPGYCRYVYINKHTNVIWASFDDKDVEMCHLTWSNITADDWEVITEFKEREEDDRNPKNNK